MATLSRLVRIFISSTFRDFMAERDELVKKVFPELRRRCKDRFVFAPVKTFNGQHPIAQNRTVPLRGVVHRIKRPETSTSRKGDGWETESLDVLTEVVHRL